ncbi:MAG: 3-deoxy-7-phosphoheptulonate synthase [Mariniblastus sp.]|jgi:3-deoxy-7-phosphoheptulonate synthase
MSNIWTPNSWRDKIITQQPVYPDAAQLDDALQRLAKLPPLVTSWEIENLKHQLGEAAEGRAFLLQGGDCSESLDDCETDSIVRNLKIIMQMSFVLIFGSMNKVIRVGRIAGQYAKPRSSDTETRDGVTLPVYRGDIINRSGFTEADRTADPELLLRGYERSALTLNFIRGLSVGGFADMHHPENWDLEFASDSPRARQFHEMIESITNSLSFMEAVLGTSIAQSQNVDFFTSHEALHLSYEAAQTRQVPRREGWYNLSTHLPWIGYRTRDLKGAHVEYFKGISNPVGIKVGPKFEPDELMKLVDTLNPENEKGRITLIHRFGADEIEICLPPIIEAVQKSGHNVLFCSDPMHGNTFATSSGIKTRSFEKIESELESAFKIHREQNSILGGVHLELTGDNVTECLGGAGKLSEPDLERAYKSQVDPRLNYDQAMELAFLIADNMSSNNKMKPFIG